MSPIFWLFFLRRMKPSCLLPLGFLKLELWTTVHFRVIIQILCYQQAKYSDFFISAYFALSEKFLRCVQAGGKTLQPSSPPTLPFPASKLLLSSLTALFHPACMPPVLSPMQSTHIFSDCITRLKPTPIVSKCYAHPWIDFILPSCPDFSCRPPSYLTASYSIHKHCEWHHP